MWKLLSCVWLFEIPWTVQSMNFSRSEYWSGYSFPPLGDLPNPGIKTRSPALRADSLPVEPQGKPKNTGASSLSLLQWIFPTQESNQGLLHCRQILYQLSYEGSSLFDMTGTKVTGRDQSECENSLAQLWIAWRQSCRPLGQQFSYFDVEGLLRSRLPVPPFRVSNFVGVGWGQKSAILTNSWMMPMLLIQGPQFENRWTR